MIALDLMKKEFISLDQEETIGSLIGRFERDDEWAAIIVSKEKYIGIINKMDFAKPRIDTQKTKIKKFLSHSAVLNGNEDLKEIARLMYASNSRILPVIKNSKPVGIIKIEDLIDNIKEYIDCKAEEIMSRQVKTINPDEKIGKAMELMRNEKISRLPVVENDEVLGIITLRDLIEKYSSWSYKKGRGVKTTYPTSKTRAFKGEKIRVDSYPVKDEMSANIICSEPDVNIKNIIDIMIDNNISSVLIAINNKLLGIITFRDILKKFIE